MPKQFQDLHGYDILDLIVKHIVPESKDVVSNLRNSSVFDAKSDHLELGNITNEIIDEVNKIKNLDSTSVYLNRDSVDNERAYANIRTLVETHFQSFKTVRQMFADLQVRANSKYDEKSGELQPRDLYQLESVIEGIDKLIAQFQTTQNYFELLKVLISFPYDEKTPYSFEMLTVARLQELIEAKDGLRMGAADRRMNELQNSIKRIIGSKQMISAPKEMAQEHSISRQQITDIVRSAVLYCGPESSYQTLSSLSDYTRQLHKLFRRRIEDLKRRQFIIPDCVPSLKRYLLRKIESELEERGSGYVMNAAGDKIIPKDYIMYEFNDVWMEQMEGKYASRLAVEQQIKRIEENINFEVVKLRAQSNTLSQSSIEQQIQIIRRRFSKDELELYDTLLPAHRKVEDIIKDSLDGISHRK